MNDENLQSLWQSQPISNTQSLSHAFEQNIQQDIRSFRHKIASRNQQESICAVIVMLIFGYYCWALPEFLMRVGSGLIVLGSAVILYNCNIGQHYKNCPLNNSGCL